MSKKAPYDFNFDVSKMTPEEVREKLREAGIPFDSWVKSDKEGEEIHTLPMFEHQAELLKQLAGLLEDQVDRDVEHISELHEQLHRLQRGGGK